jgi:FtsP/CotA-like multicopper oxidase with cupredoxin domain
MTQALIALDLVLVLLVAGLWLGAGIFIATLTQEPTPERVRRAARITLALVTGGMLAFFLRVVVAVPLANAGWWFVQEKVTLALPLLAVAVSAACVLSVPRLARLALGTSPPDGEPAGEKALVRAVAHPTLAVPVLAAAYAGVAGLAVAFVVGYPATLVSGLLVTAGVGGAAALTWWGFSRRYQRAAAITAAVPAPEAVGRRLRAVVGTAASVVAVAGLIGGYAAKRAPDKINMGEHTAVDLGGGPPVAHHVARSLSVDELRGRAGDGPVRRFTLTAERASVTLESGTRVEAWTFDGQVPGPELRVRQGDTVEVMLRNQLPDVGVALHWHGYDVPNGEDGVAGVTQDAVPPGGSFAYRFVAKQPGTYWYHSHELSSRSVRMGLFGTLVVDPAGAAQPAGLDLTLAAHTFAGTVALGSNDRLDRRMAAPGTPVRLRLVNTDDSAHRFALHGTAFRLIAVDGRDLVGPGDLIGARLPLAAGGRYDLAFTMPAGPVLLTVDGATDRGLLLSGDGRGDPPTPSVGADLDLSRYGTPVPTLVDRDGRFDRHFTLVLDRSLALLLDGTPAYAHTVNGRVYPDVPSLAVRRGDLVLITVVNRSRDSHPMHPHGHHVLVVSRNGEHTTGSPLWMDSFEVRPGEVWEVALRADNPGLWAFHCHNLPHATQGMALHLAYEGVTTPYEVGRASGNHPE